MIWISEQHLLGGIWEGFNRHRGFTADDEPMTEQLFAQMMGWA